MSIARPRRFYLLKRLEAERKGDLALASAWQGKQLEQPGTALDASFPHQSRLVAAGYVALEDVDGATVEELQQVGFTSREAAAVLAAL